MGVVLVPLWFVAEWLLVVVARHLIRATTALSTPRDLSYWASWLLGFAGGFVIYALSLWFPHMATRTERLSFMVTSVVGWPVWMVGLVSFLLLWCARKSQTYSRSLTASSIGCAWFIPCAGFIGFWGSEPLGKVLGLSIYFVP